MRLKKIIKDNGWLYWGYYLFSKGKSPRPSSITLEITHRCNLSCRMCLLYGGKEEVVNREELPFSMWQKIVDDVTPWHPNINISGGEPFLRKDLVELVRYIKGKGLRCSINSNGTMASSEKLKELLETKLNHLAFSIDGPESVHDRIRGEKGAFKKMYESICWVIKNRLDFPTVWGICVISKENVDSLDSLVDIAKKLKLDGMQFQQVMFLDEENLRSYQDEAKKIGRCDIGLERLNHEQEELDVELLVQKMKEIKRKGKTLKLPVSFLPNLTYDGLRRYYKDFSWTYGRRCLMPWMNITIVPNGDVYPCLRINMGNIRNESIRSIWNGEGFTRFRKRIMENGMFSRCRRCCHLG